MSGSGYNARSYAIELLSQDDDFGYNPVVLEDKPVVVPLLAEYKASVILTWVPKSVPLAQE